MANFMNGLQNETNYTLTDNGGVTHKTTKSALLDMFAMGAAMRNRSDSDVILMFRNAYAENPVYALKCLFYIRDVRGGQGERRFFRLCIKDLANKCPKAVIHNLEYIPEMGRWDDLYEFVGTPIESDAFRLIKNQLALDVQCETPSLLAKWLKSENTSSAKSRSLARVTRRYLNMTSREYRKTLSVLRERINVLERLMSEQRWDEIEFDKIPSKAGFKYRNAFARRDIIKAKYEAFAKSETAKVNAGTLYPYECVSAAVNLIDKERWRSVDSSNTDRLMINKYWDNLTDYFDSKVFNGIVVADTSGSMTCGQSSATPIDVAISLAMYCAERSAGPYAGNYISFASRPQLIKVEGIDFVDKVKRIYGTNLIDNTNIEAVFDLLLKVAIEENCSQSDIPQNIAIISDMEFDAAVGVWADGSRIRSGNVETVLEGVARKWAFHGYTLPHLIFWNVNATKSNIPMLGNGPISYVSGFSPSIFESILSGKSGYDLMMEVLEKERYENIR